MPKPLLIDPVRRKCTASPSPGRHHRRTSDAQLLDHLRLPAAAVEPDIPFGPATKTRSRTMVGLAAERAGEHLLVAERIADEAVGPDVQRIDDDGEPLDHREGRARRPCTRSVFRRAAPLSDRA
jgi:hypothetical protein